jgi:hypothetical protein
VGQRGHGKSRRLYFLWKSTRKSTGKNIFLRHRTKSAVKAVELVNDRMSYTVLRGRL